MRLFTTLFLIFVFALSASSQVTSINSANGEKERLISPGEQVTDLKIFPVPVLNNHFTVTCSKSIISVRMTNIIGQEVVNEKFSYPQNRSEISFVNAEKGIYLVTIEFEDKTKIVRKILVDTSK